MNELTTRRRAALAGGFAVLLLGGAFALRLVTHGALTSGGLHLMSADDYGHLRRAAAIVRDFPVVPYFDPFLGHPLGGRWIWPPLFDLAIATPTWLFWGARASVGRSIAVAAWLPPVLGALALWPVFAFGRRALGARRAALAAAVYALLPAAIAWTAYGHADQHAGEALAFLAALAAASAWLASERDALRTTFVPALALGAAVLVWQGAVFLAPIVGVSALLLGRARGASRVLVLAALVVAPFAWLAGGPTTYISFGPFQPEFLALCAALLWLSSRGRVGVAIALGGAAAAIALWPPLGGSFGHLTKTSVGVDGGGAYLAYPRQWLALIGEYRPLFSRGAGPPLSQLSLGLVLMPIAWWSWLRDARRDAPRRGALGLLLVAVPPVLAMALVQRRYVYYLAPLVALGLADVAARGWRRHRALGAAVLALSLAPVAPALLELREAPGAPGIDLLRTLARLRELDPPSRDSLRPSTAAPGELEGVMAPWSIGHLVTLFAGRPVVADNFGYGFVEQARFFTTPSGSDEEARRQLERLHCRFVITADLAPVLVAYGQAAGRGAIAPDDTLAARLQASRQLRPVPFLRLVLVSESSAPDGSGRLLPRFKIYRFEDTAGSTSG